MSGDSCEHENRRRVLAGAVQLRGSGGKRSAHEFIGLGGTSKIVKDCPSLMLTIVLLVHRIESAHASGPIAHGHPANDASTVAAPTRCKSAGREETGRDAH